MSLFGKLKHVAKVTGGAAKNVGLVFDAALSTAERIGEAGGVSKTLSVPQDVVNLAVGRVVAGVAEIHSAQVDIEEDSFVLHAVVHKWVTVKASSRFRIVGAHVSIAQQILTLEQVGPTQLSGSGMMNRIVAALVNGVFASILQVDPLQFASERVPRVTVDGNRYTVVRDAVDPDGEKVASPAVRNVLSHGHVSRIDCETGRLLLTLSVGDGFGEIAARARSAFGQAAAFAAHLATPTTQPVNSPSSKRLPPAGSTR